MSTVLIVEDDTKIQAQLEKSIINIGKQTKIYKTKTGEEALKISKIMYIDVFIIDIGLPDWDGIELAKELRQTYPYQPIIIESSKGDSNYQVHVYDKISILAFLKKPYTNEKITSKVNYALEIAETLGVKRLNIRQNGYSRQIEINDILYIKKIKNKKKLEIVLFKQDTQSLVREEFVGLTLSSLLDLLKDNNALFRCHKGFVINPKMIERLNYASNTITLKNTNDEIPIGKTFKSAIALLL